MKSLTPQEEARQLVDKFYNIMNNTLDISYAYSSIENMDLAAKESAILCIDKVIEYEKENHSCLSKVYDHYLEIKNEIQKI